MPKFWILKQSLLWTAVLLPVTVLSLIFWHWPFDGRGLLLLAAVLISGFLAGLITFCGASLFFKKRRWSAQLAYLISFLGLGTFSFVFLSSALYTYHTVPTVSSPQTFEETMRSFIFLSFFHSYPFLTLAGRLFLPFGFLGLFLFSFYPLRTLGETKR